MRKKAFDKFMKDHKNWEITKSGLIINPSFSHLGAYPDGLIYKNGRGGSLDAVLEIKCPFTARKFSYKWKLSLN